MQLGLKVSSVLKITEITEKLLRFSKLVKWELRKLSLKFLKRIFPEQFEHSKVKFCKFQFSSEKELKDFF